MLSIFIVNGNVTIWCQCCSMLFVVFIVKIVHVIVC